MKPLKFMNNLRRELSEAVTREIDFHSVTPRKGLFFLTYRCTSRCKTCTMWRRSKDSTKEIGLQQWKIITDALIKKGLRSVELFGGDVLLRKDLLFSFIRFLKKRKMTVFMPTNCNLLDGKAAQELVSSGIDKLYLSTDGIGESHDAVRRVTGSFERVAKALAYLRQARGNKGLPRIICNTTVSNLNVDILKAIAKFAQKAGYDEVHFDYVGEMSEQQIDASVIENLRPDPYFVKQEKSVLVDRAQAVSLKRQLQEIKKTLPGQFYVKTINIDMLSIKNLVEGTIPIKKCYMERNEVTVDPYGNIVVCPFVNNYILGDCLQQDIEEIWNNKKHKKFRRYQNGGKIEICRHCILSVQRNHGFLGRLRRVYQREIADNWARLVSSGNRR